MSESPNRRCTGCLARKPLNDANFPRRTELDRKAEWKSRCHDCRKSVEGRGDIRHEKRKRVADKDYVPSHHCGECFGITDRRPRVGRCKCGELWEAEPALRLEDFIWVGRSHERVCA